MDKKYNIVFTPHAERQLKKLPKTISGKIALVISQLANDPRPHGVTKMEGSINTYRMRVSDYRVVYDIFDTEILIRIVEVGHRREVYK